MFAVYRNSLKILSAGHGFETDPGRRVALYRISAIVCVDEAKVSWGTDEAGRLTGVQGWFDSVCF
jgi:hypothetical protein